MNCRTTLLAVLVLAPFAAASADTPVAVVSPETGQASQTLTLSGSLTARQSARLSPQVAGLVAELAVDAGDRVAAGDVLVRLDKRMAELEEASAVAVVNEARAALAEAERLRDEARRLVESRFVPDSEVQARQAGVLQAEAQLARTGSELAIARERLAQHIIRAPFDGVVSERLAETGEWVATGTAVLELVGVDDLWLDVRVPQQYWTNIGPETALVAFADPAPDVPLDARVHARVPVNDPSARTFLLRLLVHDESGRITPGMSARVRIELPGTAVVTLVPRDALIRYPDGTTTIWTVDEEDGRPVARQLEVTLLRLVGDRAELAGELDAGRRVVVRGNEALNEGQVVRIVTRQ
jgi:membrane fusion protein, multidrug efflux system